LLKGQKNVKKKKPKMLSMEKIGRDGINEKKIKFKKLIVFNTSIFVCLFFEFGFSNKNKISHNK
jgi:hypothetical protein